MGDFRICFVLHVGLWLTESFLIDFEAQTLVYLKSSLMNWLEFFCPQYLLWSCTTGYYIKEMVYLIFVIHGHLRVTRVACHGIIKLIWVRERCFLFPASLEFYRELHFCVGLDWAVHNEHGPVLGPVDFMALTVQTQHCNASSLIWLASWHRKSRLTSHALMVRAEEMSMQCKY